MPSANRDAALLEIGALDLLAVSVGNTRTRLGTFRRGRLTRAAAFDNGDDRALAAALASAHRELPPETAVVVGSVNPPLTETLRAAAGLLGVAPRRIEAEVRVPIRRDLEPDTAVGEDRLLDAVAAHALLGGACVVVDAGTAITVDLVDGEGTFRGGAIAPGARLMLAALHARTAQLPEVAAAKPAHAAGRSTAAAMQSGVFHALRGMVFELAAAYGRDLGAPLPILATGGDAEWLFGAEPRVEAIVPDLPLWGIALSWRAARRTKS